ncbi:putative cell division control protein [Corynespora cassiicola Philippines]|uniref:Putative cell division control protein n=1 Tax=Corynespora cassiicola Philippines TaxID=1448308 RepID=A0A2T2NKZ4_CORCC|nr:putative cell division control protein [Corynespora cassiicola Philippines]
MDQLLSLSFDNISSLDTQKIRKGLRQIEGLLAQICLSGSRSKPATPAHRRNASAISPGEQQQHSPPKKLGQLTEDPAFREFFRSQEGFEFNVASRVADCLDRLLGMQSSRGIAPTDESLDPTPVNTIRIGGQNDLLILSALSNLQGLLLLHPPSRRIFGRESRMNLLLDLLDPYNCPAIQSAALLVLVTALVGTPQNTRAFEHMDGLLTITNLFKDDETVKGVKVKLLEFLYFYLMPEGPECDESPRSSSRLVGAFARRSSTVSGDDGGSAPKITRTQAEKRDMLAQYISNVDALVQDLQDSAPFHDGDD